MAAFLDVLGRRVADVPANHARGELLRDSAMDLETNATQGLVRENSLLLDSGDVPDDAVVKVAQTFRSGTNDIDAIDYVEMFLDDEGQVALHHVACTPRSWLGWRCRPPCTIFSDIDATHRSARVVAGER
ncbi:hypothetical protein ACSRUE_21130 [Sorangium sp. KYC3313]|uniref:hypothetical protein n=1 Tax=Sorangium sp. KYC3313 TaxID=3449740 RepID=UPI003F8CDB46